METGRREKAVGLQVANHYDPLHGVEFPDRRILGWVSCISAKLMPSDIRVLEEGFYLEVGCS